MSQAIPINQSIATVPLYRQIEAPSRRVIAWVGESNFLGFGAAVDGATGPRAPFQQHLMAAGINFRMVGRGYGGLNGAGQTLGRFPFVEEFHDSHTMLIADWRSDSHGGRSISKTSTVTNIAVDGTVTAPGHTLTSADPVVLTSTGVAPIASVVQPVYYALNPNVGAGTFQLQQYNGSGSALTFLSNGSGTITAAEGLAEMLPYIAQTWDEEPTDIYISGGANDLYTAYNGGMSAADCLAMLQAREAVYETVVDAAVPGTANKFRCSFQQFTHGATNYAAMRPIIADFNAWLEARINARGRKWAYVDVTSEHADGDYSTDGIHGRKTFYDRMGRSMSQPLIAAVGTGHDYDKAPRPFVQRTPQPCIELRATADRVYIAANALHNPGSQTFWFAISYMPFALPAGINAIVQQENPQSDATLLAQVSGRPLMYFKAAPIITSSSYNLVMQQFRWHRFLCFYDASNNEAAMYLNGNLVARVLTTMSAITSQDGWAIGGIPSVANALGLYSDFVIGRGPGVDINDSALMARRDYYTGVTHVTAVARYALSEGTGLSVAGNVSGSPNGTITSGTWIPATEYMRPWERGYVKPIWDQRPSNVTAAYTATYGESVRCDPTSAGFTVTLPTAVGKRGAQIKIANVSASTNGIVVDGNASETVFGATTQTISTAYQTMVIESDGANWQKVSLS